MSWISWELSFIMMLNFQKKIVLIEELCKDIVGSAYLLAPEVTFDKTTIKHRQMRVLLILSLLSNKPVVLICLD